MKKVILSLLCVISLATAATTVALADDQSQYKKLKLSEGRKTYKSLDLPKDSVTKFSRFTWSTNMVEWLIFAPNFGVEFDLKDPTLISCPSIFLQFSYRPGKEDFMKHENYSTNALYYWRARAEYRWHFRLNERREQRRGLGKTAMWVDEKLFTKKAVDMVVDTSIIVEGGGYGTREVLSKEKRVQEKIDSTCNATNLKKPELFPGRYYLGIYGEYDNVTFNNRMLPIFGKNLKSGPVYQLGLSGGYDFPGFNYNHKCFLQWSVGASLGVFWYNYDEYVPGQASKNNPTYTDQSKILPFITELKVALNFRNSTITNKYWKPDPSVYTDNIRRNHEDSIHMAELDTILAEKPVIINVTSVNGFDSAFVENVDKFAIVQAFRNTTGLTYLLPNDFNMLTHTELALSNKELSDNYFIEYVTTNRLRNYTDSVFVSDRKNLPFRVQIAGREEADSLKKSFVDSLKNYYTNNDNMRPVFYGQPASKDSMVGFISKDSIAAKFSSIWGHQLDTSMIRTLYTGRVENNDDGTTNTYYDSIITEQNINRREIYAMFIQFHPQVTLSGEDEGVGRFQVLMAGADNANDQYNRVANFINKVARSGININVQRPWDGRLDNSFDKRVMREEVFAILQGYGMDSVDIKHVSIPDNIYEYTVGFEDAAPDTITFDFGVTENKLALPFNVRDSVGRAQALSLYNDTIRPWWEERYWNVNSGLYDDDPKVPGYYDSTEGKWLVSVDKFIEAVDDITFAHIKPYQVDTVVWRVNDNPYKTGNYAGKYRAQAHMIFHREMRSKVGLQAIGIPYLIVPVETKEKAGIAEPKPINYDSLYSVARDSVVYSYDSLGNVIDSTIIHIEATNLMSAGRDSVAYVYDSLGNVIDSTIIHIEPVALDVAKDSVVADVVSADTIKILTVEEATAASKEAAAAAKTAAAEAKAAASEAKKAASAAKKAQKAAASAIKKAEKSVNVQDSIVVTSDSIVYEKDSLGNVIDSMVVSVEHKIASELDSATQAAIAVRDSIIFAEQAVADSVTQRADSLQAVADELAAKSEEAKAAAAEAKKAIAEAKAAEKEAKKRAKEEAKAAKAAAKKAEKEPVSESAAETTTTSAATTPATSTAATSNSTSAPTPVVNTSSVSNEVSATVADTTQTQVLTLEEVTALSKSAAEAAKIAAAESKSATASAKKAAGELKKAEKSATSAIQKAEKAVKMPEDGSEPDETTQAAIAARDSIIAAENAKVDSIRVIADNLQAVANDLAVKAEEAKAAAASAKSRIAEVKAAEKARAAEAKKRAKEEAAAAKAAAKAEKEAAKAAAKESSEAVSEAATSATNEATTAVENAVTNVESATEEAVDTTGMSEKEAKAAAKKAAAEAKKKAKEEAAAAKAAAKAEKAAAKAKAKEEAAAAKAAAKAAKEAAKANAESGEENTEAKE